MSPSGFLPGSLPLVNKPDGVKTRQVEFTNDKNGTFKDITTNYPNGKTVEERIGAGKHTKTTTELISQGIWQKTYEQDGYKFPSILVDDSGRKFKP